MPKLARGSRSFNRDTLKKRTISACSCGQQFRCRHDHECSSSGLRFGSAASEQRSSPLPCCATSSGLYASMQWKWLEGGESSQKTPTHTYQALPHFSRSPNLPECSCARTTKFEPSSCGPFVTSWVVVLRLELPKTLFVAPEQGHSPPKQSLP